MKLVNHPVAVSSWFYGFLFTLILGQPTHADELPQVAETEVRSPLAETSTTAADLQPLETGLNPDFNLTAVSATDTSPQLNPPSVDPTPKFSITPSLPLLESQLSQDVISPRILTPQTGITSQSATNLVIQYSAGDRVQVSINNKPLDPKIPTQIETDSAANLVTQAWYNLPLEAGENTITVQSGNGTATSIQLNVKNSTSQLEITPIGSPRVLADGRSTITLAGKITDEKGELIRQDTVVTLTTSAGKFVGADEDTDQPGFQVRAIAGQFSTRLQSSLDAQKVRIRAAVEALKAEIIPPLEAFTQVEFTTNLRPSLVSGVVNLRIGQRGTNFWGSRRDFLNPDLIGKGSEIDLNAAVFGIGKVGDWLFTGAYNSDRPLNQTCDNITRLFRDQQFCEQQYPVYGDSSTVDYLTPSKDSVYLRFERTSPVPGAEPDYAMWGDYNTQEFARASQLFTATTRQLHGFKANYNLGNLQITGLYSRDLEGFQRDTIAPNGTSGYYFLSRRLLVPGSENVFLETEESHRPGTVIERKALRRGPDYEIDYDRGTLMFRRPILATEVNFFGREGATESPLLVRRIVATYQYEGAEGNETSLYGGRLQYNFSHTFNRESWAGATYLREDQGVQDFELYGADFLIPLGKNGQLIGEYAYSSHNSLFLGAVNGNAYRFEASGNITPGIFGRGYYRSVEENFSNNATISFTPGQTRYGAAIASQLTPTTTLQAAYDHEINFGIAPAIRTDFFDLFNPQPEPTPGSPVDNSLTTIRAGVVQKIGTSDLSLEYVNRSREDRAGSTFEGNANQLVSRLNVPLSQTLAFRAQNELNLGKSDPLYPNRTTLGLDWAVYPGVSLRLAHQFLDGGLLGNHSITSLDTVAERQLSENTTVTGRYSILSGFNNMTGQGAIGLNHRWAIAPGLRVNLGYERIFGDLFVQNAAAQPFPQPYATGQSAASLGLGSGDAYSVGIEYTDNPNFQASARFEHRTGSGGNNIVISAAAAGKLSPALTALARYQQANFTNQLLEGLGDTATIKLGLAYRDPASDKFNGLLRYEYRQNPATIPNTLLLGNGTGSTEHLLALEGIYAPNWRWEFYGKYALRNSTSYLANNFSNTNTLFLSQLRATYRLGYRTDIAGEVRWIGQPSINYDEIGLALEGGYYLTPDLRFYLGYSFGSANDRDFSGYRSDGGIYLGLTLKVNELLNGFGRQKVTPPQQQESQIQPVATTPNLTDSNQQLGK